MDAFYFGNWVAIFWRNKNKNIHWKWNHRYRLMWSINTPASTWTDRGGLFFSVYMTSRFELYVHTLKTHDDDDTVICWTIYHMLMTGRATDRAHMSVYVCKLTNELSEPSVMLLNIVLYMLCFLIHTLPFHIHNTLSEDSFSLLFGIGGIVWREPCVSNYLRLKLLPHLL